MKIETIFFDLGKVLLEFDFDIALYHVRQQSSLSEEEINEQILDLQEEIDAYEVGGISTTDFFDKLKDKFGFYRQRGGIEGHLAGNLRSHA